MIILTIITTIVSHAITLISLTCASISTTPPISTTAIVTIAIIIVVTGVAYYLEASFAQISLAPNSHLGSLHNIRSSLGPQYVRSITLGPRLGDRSDTLRGFWGGCGYYYAFALPN